MSKIIIVDDSKLMQTVLRRILERAGHEVDAWEEVSAMEIGDRLAASAPDLLITDYSMPGCNGLTVAKMARKANPGLPVLVLTATHDPAVLTALNNQEVSAILHKPLQETELLATLASVLPDEAASDPV